MSRINNDYRFHFLISCIRHSNNGKVDFTKVAGECEIVSRGAALTVSPPTATTPAPALATSPPPPARTKKTTAPGTGSKRKTAGTDADTGTHGEGEGGDHDSLSKKRSDDALKKAQAMKDKAVESAEKVVLKGGGGVKKEEESIEDEVFYGAIFKREAVEDD